MSAKKPRGPVEQRFWAKVDKTGPCWEWTGAKDRRGYGRFGKPRGNGTWIAPRLAWTLSVGPVPDGLFVCHHCDNPGCVRPDHLFVGTNADNMRDCIKKGRQAHNRGEKCGRAKLTANAVIEIHRLTASGESQKNIAAMLGVDPSAVSRVVHKKRWSHVG